MAQDRIAALATGLLAHAVDALDETTVAAPVRRYVAHGEPAFDCEQLTVHVASVRPKPVVGAPPGRCVLVPQATLVVTLVRCHPTVQENGGPPTAVDLDAAADALNHDAWALWSWLTARWRDGTLFDGLPCADVTFGNLEPRGPSGGYAAWRWPIDIQIAAGREGV